MRFLPFSVPLHLTVDSALQHGFLCRKVRVGWTSGQEKKIHTAIDFDRYLFARRVIITFDRYLHKMTLSKLLDRVFLAIYKSRTLLVVKPARLRFFSTRLACAFFFNRRISIPLSGMFYNCIADWTISNKFFYSINSINFF